MTDNVKDEISYAISNRETLYRVCQRLIRDGVDRSSIIDALDDILLACRLGGDEEKEHLILEMMDVLEGGASDHAIDRFFNR